MPSTLHPFPAAETLDWAALALELKRWGRALGFQAVGITDTPLMQDEAHLRNWLDAGYHGEMHYMQRHGTKRSRPQELVPGTLRVISVRMDYWPKDARPAEEVLAEPHLAYVSRYALGRDYHKVLRKRLQQLALRLQQAVGRSDGRVFVDSAPVLEKALAQKAGLGWIGKHTNLINHQAGSWFFLGELYTSLPLPIDTPATNHCGTCRACIDICPTRAIIAPYRLDARLCIAYLTIELRGSIPIELRPLIGNRIYGCDDCQWVCPWNKFAQATAEIDFRTRHRLDDTSLIELFSWTEQEFLRYTEGSALRRIDYAHWLRNIAVAMGNAPRNSAIRTSLQTKLNHGSVLVREHVQWALTQQQKTADKEA